MAQFDSKNIKRIGVFTSGGDAPGMNAAIRSVVRLGILNGYEVIGFMSGYSGILNGDYQPLQLRSVANIIQRGGTILKTGRCQEFLDPKYRAQAAKKLKEIGIDALVCIGGDGSMRGAMALWDEHKIPIVALPGTIDNDINGSDNTIGFDTAVNTALEAIDRIRDTAASHDRLFVVEVMGRNSGFIAAHVGLAGGAEEVFVPDQSVNMDKTIEAIQRGIQRGKSSSIFVTAEGQKPGRAYDLAESIRKKTGHEAKVCILGHVQRGGTPTASDRVLATRLGAAAIEMLKQGWCNVMVGVKGGTIVRIEAETAIQKKTFSDQELIHLVQQLAH